MDTEPNTEDWLKSALVAASRMGLDADFPGDQTVHPSGDLATHRRGGGPPVTLPPISIGSAEGEAAGPVDLLMGEKLGRGGVAIVHSAQQTCLGRDVAVKTVRPDNKRRRAPVELEAEARLTGALEHPNIIPVHVLGRGPDGKPAMVMKRVEGVNWHRLLREPDEATWAAWAGDRLDRNVDILISVCRAIEFAHSRGILHLDIKPANVMVGAFGEVYLMDWGLSIRTELRDDLPETELAGTLGFMPPEMLAGRRGASEASDVYLLGATLHFVLTGSVRHAGATLQQKFDSAMISSPMKYGADVPRELGAIANQACNVFAADRFESAGEMRQALEKFGSRRGSVALAEAAQGHLDDLLGLPVSPSRWGPVAAQDREMKLTLATNARFGFEQALHAWPGNSAAKEGLQEALEWMIQFELDRENPEAASALMNALPRKSPALLEELARVRLRLRDQGDAAQRLRRLEENLIFRGNDRRRSLALLLNGVFWATTILGTGYAIDVGLIRDNPRDGLMFALAGMAAVGLFIYRLRALMLDNVVRRRFTLAFGAYTVLYVVNHVVGVLRSMELAEVGLLHLTLLAGWCATGAALVHRQLFWAAASAVVGLLGVAAFPGAVFEWAAVATLGVNLGFAWVTRPIDGWRERSEGA